MLSRLNITGKIWLSLGVFALGAVLSTTLGQLEGLSTEKTLRNAAGALFPAAQRSQEAEAAFQRAVKGFSDAVLVQDASGLDRASEEGGRVTDGLNAIAGIAGLPGERAAEARKPAGAVAQLIGDARATYGTMLANPANMNAEMQAQMQQLAGRTDQVKGALASEKVQFSKDLHDELGAVQAASAHQRRIALGLFGITPALATVIVNLTIRRAITGPITGVIRGVEQGTSSRRAFAGKLKPVRV